MHFFYLTEVGSKGFVEYVKSALSVLLPKEESLRSQEIAISFESLQRPMESILGSKTKI